MRVHPRSALAAAAVLILCPVAAPAKAQLPPRPDTSPAALQGGLPTIVTSPTAPEQTAPNPSPEPPRLSPEYAYPAATPTSTAASALPPEMPYATPGASGKFVHNKSNVEGPYVAISFDDGPHPTLTPKLLDILKERNVKATFYVIGKNVAQYPEIVKRMAAEGHEVGNHTWNHPSLPKLSAATVAEEIQKTTRAIVDACGITPTTMRPPYGATNAALNKRMAQEFGLPVILWSVDPQDWKIRRASHVSTHLVQNTSAGDILLAHDIHPSTIEAMPATLDALLAKGFKFTTVTELLRMDKAPAATSSSGTTPP